MPQGSLTELRCRNCQRLLGKAQGDAVVQIQCKCKTMNTFSVQVQTSAASAVRAAN